MIDRLVQGTDWALAGISFKNAQPMLVERTICNAAREGGYIKVSVADCPHPYRENASASADHYFLVEDVARISFYNEVPDTLIVAPNNGNKKGKRIIS